MKLPGSLVKRVHAIWQGKGVVSTLLLPLSWITGSFVSARKRRAKAQPPRPALPTIVVGNLLVGGTGKTPVVIAVVKNLQARGWSPGVVSRGYGAKPGPQPRTAQGALDPASFGDEPSLIAASTGVPVSVHPQRTLARQALVDHFPEVDVVVSDDGLQHLTLSRDVEIVVQDARGIGNGRLLPAGPLREPASKLAEVDFIIDNNGERRNALAGSDEYSPDKHNTQQRTRTNDAAGSTGGRPGTVDVTGGADMGPERVVMSVQPTHAEHLATGEHLPWQQWVAQYRSRSLAAVAAIGQPQRFFTTLHEAGLQPVSTVALPDHDAYERSPFPELTEDVIVITAKDAVKCRRYPDLRVWVVHVEAVFSDPAWLDRLEARLPARQQAQQDAVRT